MRRMPVRLPEPTNLAHFALAQLGEETATVIDVGARWGYMIDDPQGKEPSQTPWWRLPHLATLHGFEPDAEECERLRQNAPPSDHYYPVGLSDREGEATVYLTEDPGSSSLYPPDPHFANTYLHLSCHRPAGTTTTRVQRLDTWAAAHGVTELHAIKVDTQGSELDVLRGAGRLLDTTLAIFCEVEFAPLYRGQPLYGDIARYLSDFGLYTARFDKLVHYPRATGHVHRFMQVVYAPEHIPVKVHFGRLCWADAVFLRAPEDIPMPTDDATVRTTILAAMLYYECGEKDLFAVMMHRLLAGPDGVLNDFAAQLLPGAADLR